MRLRSILTCRYEPYRFQPSRAVGCPTRYPNMASRDADAKLGWSDQSLNRLLGVCLVPPRVPTDEFGADTVVRCSDVCCGYNLNGFMADDEATEASINHLTLTGGSWKQPLTVPMLGRSLYSTRDSDRAESYFLGYSQKVYWHNLQSHLAADPVP